MLPNFNLMLANFNLMLANFNLSYRHSTEPMETKLWLNELTKIKQYVLILYHPDL